MKAREYERREPIQHLVEEEIERQGSVIPEVLADEPLTDGPLPTETADQGGEDAYAPKRRPAGSGVSQPTLAAVLDAALTLRENLERIAPESVMIAERLAGATGITPHISSDVDGGMIDRLARAVYHCAAYTEMIARANNVALPRVG